MLAELFDRVVTLGRAAREATFIEHPGLRGRVFLQDRDGEIHEKEVPPPLREAVLSSFDDLVDYLRNDQIAAKPEVYVGAEKVVAFLDRSDRNATVRVELPHSKRFKKLVELQQPREFEPRDAVKMLRLELHGGNVGHVIQALSRIDFTRTNAGRTDVAHGRESLGRSVEAAVQQADNVPEKFAIAVPVWSTHGFSRYSVNVELGLHLDLVGQKVELRVLPDEIERVRGLAVMSAVSDLRAALGDDVPVFMGTP